jgi:hypothetical protein
MIEAGRGPDEKFLVSLFPFIRDERQSADPSIAAK